MHGRQPVCLKQSSVRLSRLRTLTNVVGTLATVGIDAEPTNASVCTHRLRYSTVTEGSSRLCCEGGNGGRTRGLGGKTQEGKA